MAVGYAHLPEASMPVPFGKWEAPALKSSGNFSSGGAQHCGQGDRVPLCSAKQHPAALGTKWVADHMWAPDLQTSFIQMLHCPAHPRRLRAWRPGINPHPRLFAGTAEPLGPHPPVKNSWPEWPQSVEREGSIVSFLRFTRWTIKTQQRIPCSTWTCLKDAHIGTCEARHNGVSKGGRTGGHG